MRILTVDELKSYLDPDKGSTIDYVSEKKTTRTIFGPAVQFTLGRLPEKVFAVFVEKDVVYSHYLSKDKSTHFLVKYFSEFNKYLILGAKITPESI